MEFLKNILSDSLNGFAAKDIPFFIFQLLVAACLSHIFQLIWQKKYQTDQAKSFAIIGTGFALLTAIAKNSVAFAILALAVVIWMSKGEKPNRSQSVTSLIVGIIGVGVGSGHIVLTGIGFVVLVAILLFAPSNHDNETAH